MINNLLDVLLCSIVEYIYPLFVFDWPHELVKILHDSKKYAARVLLGMTGRKLRSL